MDLQRRPRIYLIFLISLFSTSCVDKKEADVSHIKVDLTIERFDKELSALQPAEISAKAPQLKQKYGHFYADYMESILGVGSATDTSYYQQLRTVLNNPDYKALADEVNSKLPDLSEQQDQLKDAFKHIKYYYPETKVPRLISFFSGFSVQTPVGNDYIGIGLDMFLGRDSKFYPALVQSIPQYISRRFTPENITPRVIEGFIREDMFTENDADRSLLSKMIYNGKILYMMDMAMPELADSLKIGYTTEQMAWAETNEPEVWAYFLENDLLYETDYMKIQKYLTEAPFTPGIGADSKSAPKLGVYIGWKIVKKYMERNPTLDPPGLMKETDPQKILTGSKYKPR
ncbi:gliding motility lipoprotein GldB [Flavihumibacter sp. R14]|nr:gliding motility lipoprotein GldB [Flavihumibacter soli]